MPSPVFSHVRMTRYLGATGRGGAGAQFMASEQGIQYVVKFKENGQGLRVLANELVANGIAQSLGLPCPRGVIAEIDDALLKVSNLAATYGRDVSPGCHFATERIGNAYSNPPRSLISQTSNQDTYPGIVLFDILTCNCNRNNDGNYIVQQSGQNYDFFIIDHGHCFGNPNWDTSLPNRIGTWDTHNLLPQVAACIRGSNPFGPALDKMTSLTDDFFMQIVNEVPDEWGLTDTERDALSRFLIGQRDQIGTILNMSKSLFPYWN